MKLWMDDDGRRAPDHGYPISSPMGLWLKVKAQGELKNL